MKMSVLPWKMSVQPTGWLNAEWKLEEKGKKRGVIFFPPYLSCLVNVIGNMLPDCTCARWILQIAAPSSQRKLNNSIYNEVKSVFEEGDSGAGLCFRNIRRTRHLLLLMGGNDIYIYIFFFLLQVTSPLSNRRNYECHILFFLWEESDNLTHQMECFVFLSCVYLV